MAITADREAMFEAHLFGMIQNADRAELWTLAYRLAHAAMLCAQHLDGPARAAIVETLLAAAQPTRPIQ